MSMNKIRPQTFQEQIQGAIERKRELIDAAKREIEQLEGLSRTLAALMVAAEAAGSVLRSRGAFRGPFKKTSKAPKKKMSQLAHKRGRREMMRGKRLSLRQALVTVIGRSAMTIADANDALEKRGWLPGGKAPRTYVAACLSTEKDTFERVGPAMYRVRGIANAVTANGNGGAESTVEAPAPPPSSEPGPVATA